LHVSTPLPEQVVWPGAHEPVQAPLMQVWLVQAAAELHVPLDWQVCFPLPEHCTAPGVHTPVHAPDTHAELEHPAAVPHVPLD
jgi:hypothetical protein